MVTPLLLLSSEDNLRMNVVQCLWSGAPHGRHTLSYPQSFLSRYLERLVRSLVYLSNHIYFTFQVNKLLEKFSKDCKCEGDPCEQFEEYQLKFRREKLESLIKKSEPERKAVEDGCLKVKECSEEFLKHVLPSGDGTTTPVIEVNYLLPFFAFTQPTAESLKHPCRKIIPQLLFSTFAIS